MGATEAGRRPGATGERAHATAACGRRAYHRTVAVRLKDVAERAGVSVRTVSNVVNDFPHVSPAMRQRVQVAIDELGYRPNLSARQLKYGRSGFLTFAIPRVDSPYFAELAQKFTEACTEHGFIALMDVTNADATQERNVLAGTQTHMVDGLVFSPITLHSADFARRSDDTPMVLLGERAVPPGYDHVGVDSVSASRAMVQHLVDTGRRRIGVIGHERVDGTASVRLEGYRQALSEAGLPFDDALVMGVSQYSRDVGRAAMERLLSLPEPPDAVYCFNDLMAIGTLAACRAAGVRVPEDVAVAGFDDIEESRYSEPPLTTISPDRDLLVSEVLRLLVGRIEQRRAPNDAEDVSVPWRLVVRGSTVAG